MLGTVGSTVDKVDPLHSKTKPGEFMAHLQKNKKCLRKVSSH